MRKICVIIEIEDEDWVEQNLFNALQGKLGASMKDFMKIPDTLELYKSDENFKKIVKDYTAIKRIRDEYIRKHN